MLAVARQGFVASLATLALYSSHGYEFFLPDSHCPGASGSRETDVTAGLAFVHLITLKHKGAEAASRDGLAADHHF